MTLWGDLAEEGRKEKYYLIGGLPYLLAGFLTVMIEPYVTIKLAPMSFSLPSFFLFVAVLPLIYALETLPEKALKDRDLKSYLEKAQKLAQKENGKDKKQDTEETNENEEADEKTPESPKDEEARKLAEKYY